MIRESIQNKKNWKKKNKWIEKIEMCNKNNNKWIFCIN